MSKQRKPRALGWARSTDEHLTMPRLYKTHQKFVLNSDFPNQEGGHNRSRGVWSRDYKEVKLEPRQLAVPLVVRL
jgi:hypothetical protein